MSDTSSIATPKQEVKRLRGMKIRDEFLCPITFELLIEPVVATDGHSYEREAIEKWLKSSNKSPRTGEEIESGLTPNVNLKKLIRDMVDEGGHTLYFHDQTNRSRLCDVSRQKVLTLKCLGPPESDWHHMSFQVSHNGCWGGRKFNANDDRAIANRGIASELSENMLFRDKTVSRRHFDITFDASSKSYSLRDLGSAVGTFIRVPYGVRRELLPGMILLIGKHQFTVCSIDDKGCNIAADAKSSVSSHTMGHKNDDNIDQLVQSAENLMGALRMKSKREVKSSVGGYGEDVNNDESIMQLMDLTSRMGNVLLQNSSSGGGMTSHIASEKGEEKDNGSSRMLLGRKDEGVECEDGDFDGENLSLIRRQSRRCTLTCFVPDGSPMQGQSFIVDSSGGTIGRKPESNLICFNIPSKLPGDDDSLFVTKYTNIDNAVSGDHARIEMDVESGKFYVLDGSPSRSSTNGVWTRLSGPSQESPYTPLTTGMEILVGTVRFVVSEAVTIVEQPVDDENGKGEAIRLACTYANFPFEDVRLMNRDEFLALKEAGKLAFGQVPALEIAEGKVIVQSPAIMRYIGKKTGLYPTDDYEASIVDSIIDEEADLFNGLHVTIYKERFGFDLLNREPETVSAVRKFLNDATLPRHLQFLERYMQVSTTGWIGNTPNPSIADFVLVPRLQWLVSGHEGIDSTLLDTHCPKIKDMIARLLALPAISDYYAGRK